MRKWVGLLVSTGLIAMVGCQTLTGTTMLDTAPKGDVNLKYPEWSGATAVEAEVTEAKETGIEAETAISNVGANNVEGPYGEKRSDAIDDLSHFLKQLGLAYEVIPGGHLMVKIKKRVQFDTGSAVVSSYSREWLGQVSAFLARNKDVDIIIDGHTDDIGKKSTNDNLSQRRALKVKEQLLKNQVSPGAVYTRGYGEYMPACSNVSKSGKACNRRVELTFILTDN